MAPYLIFFHFTLLFTVSVITHISTGEIGKVHIDESRNSSSSKFYSWPFYQKIGLLPIYLSVQNYSTASDVLNPTENVTIYCQQNPNTIGFSLVKFSPLYLIPPITEGYVSVEFLRPGRPVDVQCFGASYPISASGNLSRNPQFLNDTSLSKPRLLVIKRSPVINICNSTIIIPLRNQFRNITGIITAMFSESTISSVTVVCQQEVISKQEEVCQQEQNGLNAMQIMLENLTVPNNSKSFQISYTIKELGSPVKVYCEANSSEGNQYLPSTSRGYPTSFQQNQVFLNFHPSTLIVKNLSFQVYLSYTTLIIEDIINTIIQCNVMTVDCSESIATVSKCFPVSFVANNTFNVSSAIQKDISNSAWELDERIFKIKGPFYKLLQLKRTSIMDGDITETVKIDCFVVSMPNINATFTAFVSLKPSVDYNISSFVINQESDMLKNNNPFSKNFVPCSCDLKVMMCDINCCCDSDCQDFQELNFNQCPLKENMGQIPSTHLHEALNPLNMTSDLNAWFSVVWEDGTFLGIYYNHHQPIPNPTSFREIWPENYSYREKNTHQSSLNEGNGNLVNKDHQPTTNYLPQKIFSGQCITSAPLPFLVNITSDCTSYIDNDICSKSSVLSAMSYVLSTSLIDTNCVASSTHSHNNILTDVNYFCTKYVSSYIKTYNTSVYNQEQELNKSVNKGKPFETRCSWDDSYTRPPIPTVKKRQNEVFCDNVVLRVNYQFTWNRTGITFLNASIILGNVSLSKINQSMEEGNVSKTGSNNNKTCENESITHLTQCFKAYYINNDNQSESKLQNGQSENPGYLPGRPIQSGITIVNNTKSFLFIDQNTTQQISVWNPVPSGHCAPPKPRQQIMFGEDIYSSCFLPLKQVNNCETKRKEVLDLLNQLVPADRIGRFGDNDANIESHWIQILRPNITEIFPDISNSSNSSININNNSDQTNIFHSILLPVTTLNAASNSKSQTSSCDLMPVGIKLNIMYAHTGYVHGTVINEIIGAKISYLYENWTFHCNDLQLVSCFIKPNIKAQTEENSQMFTLSVAVNFIHVPAIPPKPTIRSYDFYKIKECWMKSCWQEIFYPLMITKTFDEYAYNLVTYLMFLFISLITITQSWLLLDF